MIELLAALSASAAAGITIAIPLLLLLFAVRSAKQWYRWYHQGKR